MAGTTGSMSHYRNTFLASAVLIACVAWPQTAPAQPVDTGSASEPSTDPGVDAGMDNVDADALTAPSLLEPAVPTYPDQAQGRAEVELELLVDVDGRVGEVLVVTSGGAAFDGAAKEAALALRFAPARRGPTPIPARIPFLFTFEPPPAPSPPPSAPAPGARSMPPVVPVEPEVIGETELFVHGGPPAQEPTRHALSLEEVRTVPGTGGDVLRAVESLPGVARPAFGDGTLVVRGAAPQDSQIFVDGTNVPFAYHLGGGPSVVPGDLLERLDFYPGNFGPRFGRAMGGVIDVGLRGPRRDRFHALAQVDVIDARALIEVPLGEHTAMLAAVRRSWIDAWIGPVLSDTGLSVSAAPVYWDGQLMLEHDFSRRTRLRLSVFGADDRLRVLVKAPSADDPAVAGTIGGVTRFLRTQLRLDSDLSDRLSLSNTLSWGVTDLDQAFGNNGFALRTHEFALRSDLRFAASDWLQVLAGLDAVATQYDVDARFRPYPADGRPEGPYFGRPARSIDVAGGFARPAAYAGLELRPIPSLMLLPSVRADFAGDTDDVTVDPRFSARFELWPGVHRTTLKGGVGLYHQPPQVEHSADSVGTPGIASSRALHMSFGIEQALSDGVELSLEGFAKRLSDLIVARGDESRLIGARFENTGEGRVYGGEALLRYRFWRLHGLFAYTLSRSTRRPEPGEPFALFEWDQTHILSAIGSLDLGAHFTFGLRFRYVSGSPTTPYLGGINDLDAGAYAPIASEPPFTGRLSAFHQLDVRIEKRWDFESFQLAAYLELRNAYNHRSVEAVTYNYDYSQSEPVEGLPILPVLGVRGEL